MELGDKVLIQRPHTSCQSSENHQAIGQFSNQVNKKQCYLGLIQRIFKIDIK